jgi:hypothetical protein
MPIDENMSYKFVKKELCFITVILWIDTQRVFLYR